MQLALFYSVLVSFFSCLPLLFPLSLLSSTSSAEKVSEVEVMADFTYQPELSTAAHTRRTPGNTTLCMQTQITAIHLTNPELHSADALRTHRSESLHRRKTGTIRRAIFSYEASRLDIVSPVSDIVGNIIKE